MLFKEDNFDAAVNIFSARLKSKLLNLNCVLKKDTYEIRLRAGKPIILYGKYGNMLLSKNGELTNDIDGELYICKAEILSEVFNRLCCYSVYSHIESILNGYITYQGGHRAGISGTAILNDCGKVTSVKDISCINIRIARQVYGAADLIIQHLGYNLNSILIAGPPSSGKTTVLRDYIRQLSDKMFKICVIDERQEIACINGIFCQHDIGISTDVYSNFPKRKGIMNAIKTMSPDMIALDEVGEKEEIDGIISGVNSGIGFIATIHASSYDDLIRRPQIKALIETGAFDKIVLLGNAMTPGVIEGIYDVSEVRDEIYRSNFIMDSFYYGGNKNVIIA